MAVNINSILSTDYIRPADWLPIEHLVSDGEQKIVALYAVFPTTEAYYHNAVALQIRGTSTIDWGDGQIINYADNVRAEHTYVYADLSDSTITSRGYKQAIITITPQAGNNITSFLPLIPTFTTIATTVNWLDMKVCLTSCTRFSLSNASIMLSKPLFESFYIYQSTNAMTDISYLLVNSENLRNVNTNNLNTSEVTNMSYAFAGCDIKNLNISNWNTSKCTAYSSMFYNFNNLGFDLNLSNFSTNTGLGVGCYSMFYLCECKKLTLGSMIVSTPNSMFGLSKITEIDVNDLITSNITTMSQFLLNSTAKTSITNNVKSFDFSKINMTNCTTISDMLNGARMIEECIFTTSCAKITATPNAFLSTGNLKKIRLPGIKVSFSIANNKLNATDLDLIFGDLEDLTGFPTQFFTITDNEGNATCNRAIATVKNWTVLG